VLDVVPGGQDAQRGEEGGEHDEQQGKAVHPHVVADAVSRQPLPALHELHGRGLAVETRTRGAGKTRNSATEMMRVAIFRTLWRFRSRISRIPIPDDGEEDQNGEDR
jgi:hypothetical protein